jgi:hypothetical protein
MGNPATPRPCQVRYQARAQPTRFAATFARTASAYLAAAIDGAANAQADVGSPRPAPPAPAGLDIAGTLRHDHHVDVPAVMTAYQDALLAAGAGADRDADGLVLHDLVVTGLPPTIASRNTTA